ncbi:C163A protein, partial [Urocolius indicus]|nr:C163A protein [Urocolius indicus]
LVGGDDCSGHVEIHDGEKWQSVCASAFGPRAAAVVCRELQCGAALNVRRAAADGASAGTMWERELQCAGNEPFLQLCPRGPPRDQLCTPTAAAWLTCTRLRLVNGSSACEGRVELQVQGTWGSLCASRWHLSNAHVLCRHLGCGFAVSLPRGGSFGRGTGPVWRDSFHCSGAEAHLGQCPVTVLGASPCSPEDAAAVICSGPIGSGSLRLVGGGSRCAGRVEMFQHGTWGRVLAEQWDVPEAHVVCRQLLCGEAEAASNPPKAERGTGPVGLRGVRCQGHEAQLSLCNVSWPAAGVEEDVGVVCEGDRRLRLVNGRGRCAGRVEIYSQGSWGSVCDDGWDLRDAAVVCRQLGCGGAVEAPGSAGFGEGSGRIWLDGVNCSGAEAALWDCPAGAWGRHDCGHKEDAGVVCSDFMALRLENSDGCSGRLQVFYNGTWGSVCSSSITPRTVSLACEELGCGKTGTLDVQWPRGRVSGPAWLDRVQCEERHGSFWQCPSDPWNSRSCDELRDNSDGCSGRLQVFYNGTWGSVCSSSITPRTVSLACEELGCGKTGTLDVQWPRGRVSGPAWLDRVQCEERHGSFWQCPSDPWNSRSCDELRDGWGASAPCCSLAWCLPLCVAACADPTRGHPTRSRSVSLPVIMCMVLGALVCLLLALLAWRVFSTRAERRGSKTALEPFPEAVYQEMCYSPVREEKERF